VAVDWPTISSLATAAGTLVLAAATFASVRSANRSARVAEVALMEHRRPVLVQSRHDDAEQKIMFLGGHWMRVAGGRAAAERVDNNVFLAISLRNVGAGIGVLQGWAARVGLYTSSMDHAPEHEFMPQTRDLYIPAGDIGLWQGALRDPHDDTGAVVAAERERHRERLGLSPSDEEQAAKTVALVGDAVSRRETISVELLYSDQVGGQRTISRFNLVPAGDDAWLATIGRHWYLDQPGPR
jgi:hypothetical protein